MSIPKRARDLWLPKDAIWTYEDDPYLCSIERTHDGASFPFTYNVFSMQEGIGGPAKSVKDAMKRIEDFLTAKGRTIKKRAGRLPGMEVEP